MRKATSLRYDDQGRKALEVASAGHLRLLPDGGDSPVEPALVESYRRLADVFHEVLAEQSLDALLVRIADTLAELVPHDSLTIYEADEAVSELVPVLARDDYAEEILRTRVGFDEGITGWAARNREAALVNQAHLDPRVRFVPGTPTDPEALISVPLIARSRIKGVLNIYRLGEDGAFGELEFELAKRFGDAAALALDNAEIRARLEHQARTDSLTGLFNHSVFHERLHEALRDPGATERGVAVLMLDIDDFKHVNDVHGHGVGDELLRLLADILRSAVRSDDVVCRLGGEEFAVIMSACGLAGAMQVAERVLGRLRDVDFAAAAEITVSAGLALGPEHATNARELAACAEAAMMTAKAQGKHRIVVYDEDAQERPEPSAGAYYVRSVAYMKLLQSLAGKLNRLTDVRQIGEEVAAELQSLIDYHNCRLFVAEGDDLVPIAFRGELDAGTNALPLELLRTKVGRGITGRCAQLGESILVGDAAHCEFANRIAGTREIEESLVAVPLRYQGHVVGVLVVSKLGLNRFDEDDVRLLEVVAGQAAVAVENGRLYESARREAENATALLEFGRGLAPLVRTGEIVSRVVDLSAEILDTPGTSFWLEQDGDLVLCAERGHALDQAAALAGRSFPASLLRGRGSEPFVVSPDDYADVERDPIVPGASYAVAPMDVDGRLGCLVAVVPGEDFGERELRLLAGLAQQAKLAIVNADSYEALERTVVSTVEAVANALEANDEDSSTRARSIADLALGVGRELGLDEPALRRLELGALLHDLGEVGIPSAILGNRGRSRVTKRTGVQAIPELGERIIAPVARLQPVRPIVRHCRERWDGNGGPDGLAGEEIPLESRIILVCSTYHAMTTHRSHRTRSGRGKALQRLREEAGSQFDPRVVEAVLAVLEA